MSDVQLAKKELLETCQACMALFGDKPIEGNVSLQALSVKLFRTLEIVLKEGSTQDQGDALRAFAKVLKAFKVLHSQIWGGVSASDSAALLKNSPYISEEQVKEFKRLSADLLKLAEE